MRKILFLILIIAGSLHAAAKVAVEARIDSIEMFIGQQVHVTLSATTQGKSENVVFPTFQPKQMITPGVEVLDMTETQTSEMNSGETMSSRVYTLTSFDANLYYLPPFEVKVDGKVYKTKSLALKVLGIEVDTTNVDNFFGYKDVQDNPFQWSDWSLIFWLSVLMLLIASADYYLYLRLRDNKPIISHLKVVKRLLPHQKAMKAIEQIKAEKMATSENTKEYYTKLTDTLRQYIQERYGFNAKEMVSSEIIERLTALQDQKALDELRMLFQTADLVKFAKYSTLINENDMNLVNAIEFINSTKIEQQTEEKPKPQLTEAEERSIKTRRVLKTVIAVLAAASVILLCYVVYSTYQLLV